MANNVGVNGRSVVTEKSDGTMVTLPNVCKTPSPGGPVPLPYPSIAKSSDLANGTSSVLVNGVSACVKGSYIDKTSGDEAGTAGGLISGDTGGKAEPMNYSFDVKFEGNNVVRGMDPFISNKKNTPPGPMIQPPVVLSEMGEGEEEEEKLYTCEWKDCEGNHTSDINKDYPRDAVLKRGKAKSGEEYADEWINNGLEPWVVNKSQKHDPNADWDVYKDDLQPKDPVKDQNKYFIDLNVELSKKGQYVTQKHHLISQHFFTSSTFADLAKNCELIGYNINEKENGICLPYFVPDIVRHDLQCHRGHHGFTQYNDNVGILLTDTQKDSIELCGTDNQEELITSLNELSEKIKSHILKWNVGWEVRSKAHKNRSEAYARINQPVPK
jgi:hypothetical protein